MESIGKLNAAIYRSLNSIINAKLKDIPIKSGQHDFLYVIGLQEGITQKELSERLHVGKATTAKACKSLLLNGYIRMEKDKKDKRFERLHLTELGHAIAPRVRQTFLELVAITTRDLSPEETETAIRLLKKILETLTKEKQSIGEALD